MNEKHSIIDRLIHDRLTIMKNAPDRIRQLEKQIETAKMKPAELRAAQELLAALRKAAPK